MTTEYRSTDGGNEVSLVTRISHGHALDETDDAVNDVVR